MKFKSDKQRKAVMMKYNNWKQTRNTPQQEVWVNNKRGEVQTIDKSYTSKVMSVSRVTPKGAYKIKTGGSLSFRQGKRKVYAKDVKTLASKYREMNR